MLHSDDKVICRSEANVAEESLLQKPLLLRERSSNDNKRNRNEKRSRGKKALAKKKRRHALDIRFLIRLWRILVLSVDTPKLEGLAPKRVLTVMAALLYPVLLVACFVGELLLGNEVGLLSAKFSVAIIEHVDDRDAAAFIHVLWMGLLMILAVNMIKSMRQFVHDAMVISWRNRLTRNIHGLYFADRIFYRMTVLESRIDNPDHRITIDGHSCIRKMSDILANTMAAPMNIVFYTAATYQTIGWKGPVACYAFFFVGSMLNKILISPVVALRFVQEREEGNFRFAHVSLRTNAETVAFYDGARREHDITDSLLQRVISNLWRIAGRMFLLNFHMNFFGYLGAILSYGILGAGAFIFGIFEGNSPQDVVFKIQTFSFQCMMLIYGFTQFIQIGTDASELAGHTARVGDMLEEIDRSRADVKKKVRSSDDISTTNPPSVVPSDRITFKNVTIRTPSSTSDHTNLLLEKVSFEIKPGQHTLITGPSGSGKSSVLRVLAGLWDLRVGDGIVHSPHYLFYIPQTAYTVIGTLHDQVTYPVGAGDNTRKWMHHNVDELISAEEETELVRRALERSRLGYLLRNVPSLDFKCNWDSILSGGERQRLSFSRLFFHVELAKRAQESEQLFVIMDESTNSLDIDTEQLIFEEMFKERNLTVVTVGHRQTLYRYHQSLLELDPLSHSCTLRKL